MNELLEFSLLCAGAIGLVAATAFAVIHAGPIGLVGSGLAGIWYALFVADRGKAAEGRARERRLGPDREACQPPPPPSWGSP